MGRRVELGASGGPGGGKVAVAEKVVFDDERVLFVFDTVEVGPVPVPDALVPLASIEGCVECCMA